MKHINLFGPVNMTGYGIHFTNILKEFLTRDISLYVCPIGGIDPATGLQSVISNLNKSNLFVPTAPSLQVFHDTHANQFTGSVRGCFSIFETTQPFDIDMANTCDLIFTTTDDHANIIKTFLDNPNKIITIPEGVDPILFNASKTDKLIENEGVTFFTGGKHEMRKNTDNIIKAYIETMGDKKTTLICHTFNGFPQYKQYPFTRINIMGFGYKQTNETPFALVFSNGPSNIVFTKPGIKDTEIYKLYNSANVNISCSSGEGWDLVLNEALALGIPSIVTDCLGHKQYISDYEYPELIINTKINVLAKDDIWFNGNQGTWSEVSIDEIKTKINLVYNNAIKYINKNVDMGNRIANKYNWKNTVDKIIEAFDAQG